MNRIDFLKQTALGIMGATVATAPSAAETSATPSLKGQTALVTGAARGIGRAAALELARQGANVALLDIANPNGIEHIHGYQLGSRQDLEETLGLVRQQGVKAIALVADVRKVNELKRAAEQTVRELGNPDILVANAGIAIWSPFETMTPEQFTQVTDVNITGVANSVWAVLPQMKKQNRGRIITLSSIGGRTGVPGVANYAASKWAVIGLTKTLALELGKYNITVNSVAPTAVNTPLYRSEGQYASTGMHSFGDQDKAMFGYHALNVPAVEPQDIADAIAFLASPSARYISGAVIDVAAGGNARYTA